MPLKMSWMLTSAITSSSNTRYWGVTPRPDYMVSEKQSLKRFTSSALFRDKAERFCKKDATVDEVVDGGEAALVCLHSGKDGDNLNDLRYAKFCDKVATNKVHIRPQTLPPTSVAARYHNMRVYLQVQQRLGVCNMKETDWGWMTNKDDNLDPAMTDLPPAPDELLVSSGANALLIAAQADAVVASTAWSVPLLVANAEVSDVLIVLQWLIQVTTTMLMMRD